MNDYTMNEYNTENPQLGIFWYDTSKEELFGIESTDVNSVEFRTSCLFGGCVRKTIQSLHYTCYEKHKQQNIDSRFDNEFTTIPRGRVFNIQGTGFVVAVGKWFEDHPEAKNLILLEFNLPIDTEFRIIDPLESVT